MDIVEELRQNRESGAKRLVSEYKAGLMSLACRFYRNVGDAEELVNATFAKVVENIDDYLEQSAFFAWMSQILTNEFRDRVRRKSNKMEVYPGVVPEVADESAQRAIFASLDASLLREAIETLPEDIKKTVLLHYFMDMPVKEVARVLSSPTSTITWRLHYARQILAAKLGAATKKPGGKVLLIALALATLTAIGAVVGSAVSATRSSPPDPSGVSPLSEGDENFDLSFVDNCEQLSFVDNDKSNCLQTFANDNCPQTIGATPSILPLFTTPQGTQPMRITSAKSTAALLASASLALTASASTVTVTVPINTDYTLAQAFANGCVSGAADVTALCAADDLQIAGTGRLVIDQDLKTSGFAGTIHVNAGATLRVTVNGALGDTSHGTFVADGATFETLAASGVTFDFRGEPLSFAGAGVDGMGALKALSTTLQYNGAWGGTVLTMAGDAKVFSDSDQNQVFLLRDYNNATLNMNGHTLTIAGRNQNAGLTFRAVISNPGDIVTTNVHLMVRRQAVFPGGASHTLRLEAGSRMQLYECGAETRANRTWKILVPPSGTATPININTAAAVWNGPVEFQRAATVAAPYSCEFGGSMTASALVTFEGYEQNGRQTITLAASTNDLRGGVATTAADIQLGASGANDVSFHAGLNYGIRTDASAWNTYYYTEDGATTTNKVVLDFTDLEDGTKYSSGFGTFYAGYIWNPSSSPVTWRLAGYANRLFFLKINGNKVWAKPGENQVVFNNVTLNPGANSFDYRLATGGNGLRAWNASQATSANWTTGLPVAYCTTSTTSTDPADFTPLADPGDGSVLRLATEGTDYWNELAAATPKGQAWASLTVAHGETINVGQSPLLVGNLSGSPNVASTYVNTKADAFTVTGTWSMLAADIENGDVLESDVALAFGAGSTLSVIGIRTLADGDYVIARSDERISGIPALAAMTAKYATLAISIDGKSLVLKVRAPGTTLYIR